MFTITRNLLIRRPRLFISDLDIRTPGAGFQSWRDIRNGRLVVRLRARGIRTKSLCFDYPGGSENLELMPYAVNRRQMERLLYVYRHRNQPVIFTSDRKIAGYLASCPAIFNIQT